MEKTLCLVGVIGGDFYQEYIPIFIFSALKSYPNYDIIIYVDGKLKNNVKQSLKLLKSLGFFKIKEKALSIIFNLGKDKENLQNLSLKGQSNFIPYLRWVLLDEELFRYKYIYIGDIDIFVVPERPSLLKQHINHMEKTHLCYSNKIRVDTNQFERFTGLHFIKTMEYYHKAKNVIKKYQKMLVRLLEKKINIKIEDNEYMLYKIILESDLEMISLSENFRPLHGIHFGLFRNIFNICTINERYSYYKSYIKSFLAMIENSLFIQVYRNIKNIELKLIILRAKWNYKQKLEKYFLKRLKYQTFEIILTLMHLLVHLKNKVKV